MDKDKKSCGFWQCEPHVDPPTPAEVAAADERAALAAHLYALAF